MKKGISIWSFSSSMSITESMRLAKEAGFDGIELALNEKGALSLESDPDEIMGYRHLADQIGIEISSLATGLFWSYALTSGYPETRRKALEIGKKQLEFASLLGVDTILVVPGAVGVDFIPGSEVVDYDVAYQRSFAAIKELSAYAEEKQVHIGVENVWNKFLLSPLEMRDFIDGVGSAFVGAYLDVGNLILTGYPEQWIRILGKRIRKVHFKDFKREVGTLAGFVDLLSGDVNFPAVMDALKKAGYDSYVIAEMSPPKYYPEQLIYRTSLAMDQILGR